MVHFEMMKGKRGVIPLIPIFIIVVLGALFTPAIIRVWQLAFFKFDTSNPLLWAVVGVFILLMMLRRNKQQYQVVSQ